MSDMKALQNEYKKTSERGKTRRFEWVDTDVLERLGIKKYKTKEGDNFLRIIPTPKSIKGAFYGLEVWKHSNIGPDGNTYLCLRVAGKKCPICEYVDGLKRKNPDDPRIKELRASQRYLFFVYDVTNDKSSAMGLHWFDSPAQIKDEIIKLSRDRRTQATIDVSDAEKGCDVEFNREGMKQQNTKYSGFKLAKASAIPDEWLDGVPDFEDVLLVPEAEELKKQLFGMDDEIEPEREKPTTTEAEEEPAEVVDDEVKNDPKAEKSASELKQKVKEEPKEAKETIKERIERLKKERSKE
jgi:hypothetical protein